MDEGFPLSSKFNKHQPIEFVPRSRPSLIAAKLSSLFDRKKGYQYTYDAINSTLVIEEPMVNKWVSRTNRRAASGRPFCFNAAMRSLVCLDYEFIG